MKYFYQILVLFLLHQASLSQTYHPMVVDSSLHVIKTYHADINFTEYKIYLHLGDTVIQGKNYIKTHQGRSQYPDTSFSSISGFYYTGAIREVNKRVYVIESNDTIERLMYDFNLNISDTLKQHLFPGFHINLVLQRIDSTLIYPDSIYRKSYHYLENGFNRYTVIEGIGMIQNGSNVSRSTYFLLECVQIKFKTVYQGQPNCSCASFFYKLGFASLNENSNDIILKVFPNPATESISLMVKNNNQDINSIKILNLNGVLIKQISQPKIINNQIIIETTKIPPGLYFIVLNSGTMVSTKKFIKQ